MQFGKATLDIYTTSATLRFSQIPWEISEADGAPDTTAVDSYFRHREDNWYMFWTPKIKILVMGRNILRLAVWTFNA